MQRVRRKVGWRSLWMSFLAGVLTSTGLAQPAGVFRQVYSGIGGVAVSDLTSHPSYPNSPTAENLITDRFEAPTNVEENYGQRLRALIQAPVTGNYTFWIASDDGGQLWLSDDDTPGNKRLIAQVPGWTSARQWTKYAQQQSAPIALVSGRRYYIEALMKEGGGGDNLAVRWQLPSGTFEAPIPASRLTAYGLAAPEITQQPASLAVVEGSTAEFSIRLASSFGATFQWQRNGVAIPGATSAVYSIPVARLSDSGATFRCVASNNQGAAMSNPATLTVNRDLTPPTALSASNLGSPQLVSVLFSEPVEPASATSRSNYSLNGGVGIVSASLDGDGRTVILTTTPLNPGTSYTVTITGVRDRASNPNSIAAGTRVSFVPDYTPLGITDVFGRPEAPGPSSRRTGLVISELMYHPPARADGKDLEFVELYNSNPFFQDLGGYRLSGAIDYTFPAGTRIAGQSHLVIARSPVDLKAAYSLGDVLGPYTNRLENGSGVVRLRNDLDAVLLEAAYSGGPPYPPAADGAGHSLVLARPSYGEGNPQAWTASALAGGSPGTFEPTSPTAYATVVVNEFLAHTDDPQPDFIELYNYSSQSLDISGCWLTDDPVTNRFRIPAGTVLPPKGFVSFDQSQLGFALDAAGETIYLRPPAGDRVIDAIRFGAQENGVSSGRSPDGAPTIVRLAAATPGLSNTPMRIHDIVIHEILYHPISDDPDDQFVEIFNRGSAPVHLGGWRLDDAIEFEFPEGTWIAPQGYWVVGRSATQLLRNHPHLTSANTLGDFSGSLSRRGERLTLKMPDDLVRTNSNQQPVTNRVHIVVDEVTYGTGGRWGRWSDGGGSSLELIDAESDHRLAPNWADSDETRKSGWTTVETTGVLDNGNGTADALHIFLQGAGECLVDSVEVFAAGGPNRVANSTFETDASGWFFQGTHDQSGLETGEGYNSNRSLRIRASGRGDTGANRVRTPLTSSLSAGQTVTLRARVRWLSGNPEILLRLKGNWLEAPGLTVATRNLGTPGLRNSRAVDNAGPAITHVSHSPVLPTANQAVTVTARVHDPDGLAALQLVYRVDPATNFVTVPMANNGAGLFSGILPGQPAGRLVAFFISARDGAQPSAASNFPADAPARECLVRFGDPRPTGGFGSYLINVTSATEQRWIKREKNSNAPLDATFAYGNDRVVYNAGTLYSGSPWHTPGFSGPSAGLCDYVLVCPDDDTVLGATDFVLASVGNLGNDASAQAEQAAFWILGKLGVQNNYRRYVRMVFNGQRRGTIFEDAQQPGSDIAAQWFPDDNRGDLHKIEDWFEFDDTGDNKLFNVDARLEKYVTTGGAKKLARYRWNWRKRAVSDSANAYTNLFQLVDALNQPAASTAYALQTAALIDFDQWARTFCGQHIAGNWDSYGYGRGKNMYAYKPDEGPWQLWSWDIDFVLGSGSDGPQTDMFANVNDPTISRLLAHPPFRRAYFRAMEDAVQGPLLAGNIGPILDAKYAAFQASGVSASSPSGIKSYVEARRRFIETNHLARVAATFALTSNGGADFSTNKNAVTLAGTAPVAVATLEINGVAHPLSWTTVSNWTATVALAPGVNRLNLRGYDLRGSPIATAQKSIAITYTGPADRAEDVLVINEIMYNAVAPDASYIELFNRSSSTAFDLSNWRIDGAAFAFPDGTIIQPGAYLVIANNAAAFATAYGLQIPLAGTYDGRLQNDGETLRLIRPGATPDLDAVIDEVTYSSAPPWPSPPNGFGPSLQLIDPAQDNNRVMNWAAATGTSTGGTTSQTLVPMTQSWKYNQAGTDLGTTWRQRTYTDTAWPAGAALHYNETAALPAPKNTRLTIGPSTFYFRTRFNFDGNPAAATLSARTIIDDGAVVYLNGTEVLRLGMPAGAVTSATFASRTVGDAVSEGPFPIPNAALVQGENVLAVEVHQVNASSTDVVFGLSLEASVSQSGGGAPHTPGAINSVQASLPTFPALWLNEVVADNGTGIQDRTGDRDPWVELYNSGSTTLSLAGFHLSDNPANLLRWAFPAGASIAAGQRLVIWLDGEPAESTATEWHTSFRIPPLTGSILLSRAAGGESTVIDYINYTLLNTDRARGAFPDGTGGRRRLLYTPTPGTANSNAYPPFPLFINEWMAANTSTLADPADGDFDDWMELFNAGPTAIDLSGFTLTDDPLDPGQWAFPEGTVIGPGGRLLIWADGETGQNKGVDSIHAGFRLGQAGEDIALYNPLGALVDRVTFGAQTNDVSQGRWPDGNTGPLQFMPTPTPRLANISSAAGSNIAPNLAPIGNRSVNENNLLTITAQATDPNVGQDLTFSLAPGAPPGMVINPASGIVTWTPSEANGPGAFTVTIRVTDNGSPALVDEETITVAVSEVNAAPTLAPIEDRAVASGATITFAARATDPDLPVQALVYSLESSPAGATIDPATGVFTWTPSPAQSGQIHFVTVVATDTGFPPLNAAHTFRVNVVSGNGPPSLAAIGSLSVAKGSTLTFRASATDPDGASQSLRFSLGADAPPGAAIDPLTGVFTWTPGIAQGPGTFPTTIIVTDNGAPPLSDSETISIDVTGVNTPPVLAFVANQSVPEGTPISLPILGGDRDLPPQRLTYSLDPGAPAGAAIDQENLLFLWTPGEADGPGLHTITIRVTDSGNPPLSDARTFTVTVSEVNTPPVLEPVPTQTVNPGTTLRVQAQAKDADLPAQKLTYSLAPGAPTGATIDAASGAFSWSPPASEPPGTRPVTVRVSDNGSPPRTAEQTFTVSVQASASIRITGVAIPGLGLVRISWSSEPQQSYQVQYTDDLRQGTWTNLGEPVRATASSTNRTDTQPNDRQRYYRIILAP